MHFSFPKLKQMVLPFALCAVLTACGTKTYQTEDYISTHDSLYEDYMVSVDEESGPLLEPELHAFLSVGDIDKDITAEQLKLIEPEYKHYVKNPRGRVTIERFMYRAMPYLDFTKKVFREKNMPEELAYLAFVESGYHPFARSSANALGMWQFMAPTARHCGLTINWWLDERLDPYKATAAAADYLQEMYNEFHDWYLALAAYNAGPGKIRRALSETGTDNFFDLMAANDKITNSKIKIKQETADYVPRFLAMTKIMRNFHLLGFTAKEHDLGKGHSVITEQAVAIKAQRGTDLKALARKMDMPWQTFRDYNPAFLQAVTPLDADTWFYVPVSMQAKGLEASKIQMLAGWSNYTIKKGDTLSAISRKTGVPVHVLRQANTISEPLKVGHTLKLPAKHTYIADNSVNGKSKAGNAKTNSKTIEKHSYTYKVKSGDTFRKIATSHGLTVAELKVANPKIKDITKISRGQKIYIPQKNENLHTSIAESKKNAVDKNSKKAAKTQELAQETSKLSKKAAKYTIQRGDTLYSVAKKHGLTVAELQKINNGLSPQGLAVGQEIFVSANKNTLTAKNDTKQKQQTSVKSKTYTVKQGDTLYSIAKAHGYSVAELKSHNKNLTTSLSIGQNITIPAKGNHNAKAAAKPIIHIVKKGETLYSIGRSYNVSVDAIIAYNKFSGNSISVGQKVKIPSSNYTMASANDNDNIQ